MAAQRQYQACTIMNARIVDMRHLWHPSDTYKGQKTQKPNYFSMFIVPKSQQHWSTEPVFANAMGAFGELLRGQLQAFAQQPAMVQWPIVDGDMPNAEGKSSEFAKGHWLFSASSGNPPNVELVQAGGALVKLQNKVGVKAGDFVMLGATAAVKANQPNGVKFYLNAVVFTAPGEEIVFANSVSGAELMKMAEQQGLRPAGFSALPGGFGGGPGGFAAPGGAPYQPPGGGFAPPAGGPGGFQPPGQGAGGFTAPGAAYVPTQGGHAPTGAPAPTGPGFTGNAGTQFPSNGAPNFTPPQQPGGWPQR